jgi:hypothetical protein
MYNNNVRRQKMVIFLFILVVLAVLNFDLFLGLLNVGVGFVIGLILSVVIAAEALQYFLGML